MNPILGIQSKTRAQNKAEFSYRKKKLLYFYACLNLQTEICKTTLINEYHHKI